QFPTGLANSSGAVGKYLTDSVGSGGYGYFPQLEKMPPHNHDGVGGMHMYMPWWKFDRKNDFPRGYHIEFGGGREMPGVGMFNAMNREEDRDGVALKRRARETYACHSGGAGGEDKRPNPETRSEIVPEGDDDGLPAALLAQPDNNPTLTIRALGWRASGCLLDEARKGNL